MHKLDKPDKPLARLEDSSNAMQEKSDKEDSMPSKRWLKKAEIYKLFAKGFGNLDFSERAAKELYDYESQGKGNIEIDTFARSSNGYAVGKKWCDVQVSSWLNDFKNNRLFARMCLEEMYLKKQLPKWFLDSIFYKPFPLFKNMIDKILGGQNA